MKTIILSTLFSFASFAVLSGPASASDDCQSAAQNLRAKQATLKVRVAARADLVEAVEVAGEAWDDLEVQRRFSPDHADRADESKAIYEAAKADLFASEEQLQADNIAVNQAISRYNSRCASRN